MIIIQQKMECFDDPAVLNEVWVFFPKVRQQNTRQQGSRYVESSSPVFLGIQSLTKAENSFE